MYRGLNVGVAIPALNEEASIGLVVGDLRSLHNVDDTPVIDDVVVCDNGSSDATAARASEAGARIAQEDRRGYGSACLAAIAKLRRTDVVLFTDADHAFHASQATRLLDRIAEGADLVIGSRAWGHRDPGALSPTQVMGNRLATVLIRFLWGPRVTDLGPYRCDSIRGTLRPRDARSRLRLDGGNAGQGHSTRIGSRRSAGGYPGAYREVEDQRHRPGVCSVPVSASFQ